MFTKKKELLSAVTERTSEWILSQEIPSDLTINVGGTSFALHKFPLVTKCGYIKKLISKSNISTIEIHDIPGGSMGFEIAAKFCYGINFEISLKTIALIRCVAEFLEMTEENSIGNLANLTESYLKEVALKSIKGAISILHSSEKLLPIAENVKLVNRSIDTIAYIVFKNSQFSSKSGRITEVDDCINGLNFTTFSNPPNSVVDLWAEDLSILRIDFFQRVIIAIMARGYKQFALGSTLMLYAQKYLRGLEISTDGKKRIEPRQEHEKRVILETIVSLLPREKNALPISFLSMLLRVAIYIETTVSCRVDLEKRMSMQLGQAALDDLCIPSYTGDTLYDVETAQRIMTEFIQNEMVGHRFGLNDEMNSCSRSTDVEKVAKLAEDYLAKIASEDSNLSVSKFVSIAEVIPEQSRITDDGIYKAIDIYLKAHPTLSDTERKQVCSVMNCQKLTREACAHAAKNESLPVQIVMQVLYYEQRRLREVKDGTVTGAECHPFNTDDICPVTEEFSSLKKENQDLKFELVKMKTRLKEVENSVTSSPTGKPRVPRKSFLNSVSRKLGKFHLSFGVDEVMSPDNKGQINPKRGRRRYSIS